jgi:SulP family sulfate permease
MTGFMNGIAVLIILGQLGYLTGYSSVADNSVIKTIDLWRHRGEIDPETLAVGLTTVLLILVLEKTALKKFGMPIAMLSASLLVPLFDWKSVQLVGEIAYIPDSLPTAIIPPPSVFFGMVIPALSLAFVGLVQGATVAKQYVNPDGEYPDASGDFVGQGAANLAAGVFQGMPVGGSLSATSLAISSGASSRLANITAGLTVAIILLFFTDFVNALAMPALGGLLIVIGFRTLRPVNVRMVWQTGTVQRVVMLFTFIATLFIPLQYAVLFGVALAFVLFVIRQSNMITLKEVKFADAGQIKEVDPPDMLPANEVTILMPYGSLFFAAATNLEDRLPEVTDETRFAVVILYLHGRSDLDSTFLDVLERYTRELKQNSSKLMLSAVNPHVKDQLLKVGLIDVLGRENIYPDSEFLGESTREAYYQAQQWIEETQKHAE